MDREAILKEMSVALEKVTEQKPAVALSEEVQLKEGLGLDSFAALELLFELEEALDVRIPQEQASSFKTVGDVVAFIQAQAADRAGSTDQSEPTSS